MHEYITKDNQSLDILCPNLSAASQSVEEKAYVTYVHPELESASTVWYPYHQKDIQAIKIVQRRVMHVLLYTIHVTAIRIL